MKAKYIVVVLAVGLSVIFGTIYWKWFTQVSDEMTVYVVQTGAFKEEANANEMIQQLTGSQVTSYTYTKGDTIFVISDIFVKKEEAEAYVATLTEKQITNAIREFSVPKELEEKIVNKDFTETLEQLAVSDD